MRRAVAAFACLVALPAAATLTDEKYAFARETPCPSTGYKKISCPGYVIVYPACQATRANMRWVPANAWDQAHWNAQAQRYCTCLSYPVEVLSVTTRGRTAIAVKCQLW